MRSTRQPQPFSICTISGDAPRGAVGPAATPAGRRRGVRRQLGRLFARAFAGLCLAGAAAAAFAGSTRWHADLETAARAAASSRKPVLVIFTAAWSPSCEQFVQKTLPTAEVEAILDACFEPVRLDVDAGAAVAKEHGVAHLPTACVLDASGRLLARFECPEQPAEFVRLAASAARETSALVAASPETAAAAAGSQPPPVAAAPVASVGVPARAASAGVPGVMPVAPGFTETPAAVIPPATTPSPAVAPVESRPTASAFSSSAQAAYGPPAGRAASSAFSAASESAAPAVAPAANGPATASGGSAFTSQPAAPASPPASGFTPSGFQPRPFVEPAATPVVQPSSPSTAPWLGSPPAAQPAAASPQPAPGAGVASYSGFPGYATVAPPAGGVQAGGAAAVAAPTPTPSTTAAATPPAKDAEPLKENPVVSFFRKPFAGFESWASRDGSTAAKSGSDKKDPIVKPADQAKAAAPAVPGPSAAPAGMPLGLEGYCPVTLKDKAAWVEGRTQYGACHRGRTYLFAGEAEQRAFLANPDLYSPALSGDDPVMAFDAGRQVPGQRQYGVTYQSRVYLFSSPETQAVFTASPERYVGRVVVAENPTSAGGTIR